ncbi:MAG: malto-oligosyltrehalose synthase [Acetobacteraceae bacterium]|nr:malto-oligosyltrehalose synthase [Acetobacteraceae bacterium]
MTERTTMPLRATMRLQFNKEFTFEDALRVVPYLAELGISHLYASPILTARPGSMHGYDVVDATQVSPELGGETGLRRLVAMLRAASLGLIVDIVPNHMAVGHDNAWWNDVLQYGAESRFASYFDIDWQSRDPSLHGKVLAPFLGTSYGTALAAGELRLDQADGMPVVRYFDALYPIDPATWTPSMANAVFDPAKEEGRRNLHRLLEQQHYRLAWWGTAADEINWRRFFDINGLAGIRVEVPEVFEAAHETLFRLYAEGLIDGMRVDHVDGLSDPPTYCRRLRMRLSELERLRPDDAPKGPAYIVVEKILGAGEAMPTDWDVDGTSGYDFMDAVNALQHDPTAEPVLAAFWASISRRTGVFYVEETQARQEILRQNFNAQLESVAVALHGLARENLTTRDISHASIRRALIALLAQFRVYRLYEAGERRSTAGDAAFRKALEAAKAHSPAVLQPVLDQLDIWLGADAPAPETAVLSNIAGTRFQQLSAPVAAKAVEDTAFYRYGRLLSRNDVGFNAAQLGMEPAAFHETCSVRAATFPGALLATATHDHKRGEDVRSRLAVLSEIPSEWEAAVRRWRELNQRCRASTATASISDGDEAMLYQMIVGAWPTELEPVDRRECEQYADRLAGWLKKAIREAKLQTDWTMPNAAYETAAHGFLMTIFRSDGPFLTEAAAFAHRIGPAGAVNGLAQTLLKMTSPGTPDFFQGTEFWDFSLVDPDNRRPVDFEARSTSIRQADAPVTLASTWRNGRVKQAMIARTLHERRRSASVFACGSYTPVAAIGPRAEHIVAFLRSHGDQRYLVVVPRLPRHLLGDDDAIIIPPNRWDGTRLQLPDTIETAHWEDILTSARLNPTSTDLPVAAILRDFPAALLKTSTGTRR